jgi:two-component system, cell cycle sensor histidine kinase and response regulator CckA
MGRNSPSRNADEDSMGDNAAIIIVEDEFIVALDIQRHLERNGYEVKGIFASGEELLAHVEELHPDLVLMDIRLQGKLDGVDTAAILNDKWSVPVILLTAYADETTLARAKISQPFGYLLKPFEERELRISIEIALYRAKMERKLRESERLLYQAQKMEAVGRLAGGIAHDFNNILTAILGYANLLSEEAGDNLVLRNDVEGVKKAAKRAESLTRQLLAFSRRQPMEPRVVDPGEMVRDMERMLQRLLPANVSLSLNLVKNSLHVRMDPTQFEQILLNLVVNAKDALPGGGYIQVSLGSQVLDVPREGSVEQISPGSYVVLAVQDNGVGIPPEDYARIFEPFFTTKAKGSGTGLGLATVYGIVKQSNGFLDLASKVGSGTTFSIFFPRLQGGECVKEEEQPENGQSRGTENILIVEDDDEIRNLMEKALARMGYVVATSAHPGEAILVAEKQGYKFDLIIADIGLPFMTGIELVERMRKEIPVLKALFVSGYPDRVPEIANSSFLPKPFTEDTLASAVRNILDEDLTTKA